MRSSLVNGLFKVAVLPFLPIKGVDFILGNDIAGGKVVPAPEVLDSPVLDSGNDLEHSEIFSACAVTRAQAKKYGPDLSESFCAMERVCKKGRFISQRKVPCEFTSSFCLASVDISLPASREEFISAQQQDESYLCSFSGRG